MAWGKPPAIGMGAGDRLSGARGVWGIGQIASGAAAIGKFGLGRYVLAQDEGGKFLVARQRVEAEAVAHLMAFWQQVSRLLGQARCLSGSSTLS